MPRGKVRRDEPLALARSVPQRIATLADLLALGAARPYAQQFRLAAREWRILAVLGEGAPMSAAALAKRTAIDKGRVSRTVDRLQRRALVEREPDAFDGRRAILRLTPKGRATYRRIVPFARARERALLASLTPAERRLLERVLAKLLRRAEALLGPAAPGDPNPDRD
jgi:DNA-binding MarR family transcriptional regulator